MAFEYWNSLPEEKKREIYAQAEEAHDKSGRRTCYWCGTPLTSGCDFTSYAADPREICKGVCKARRFFDNPEGYERRAQHGDKTAGN